MVRVGTLNGVEMFEMSLKFGVLLGACNPVPKLERKLPRDIRATKPGASNGYNSAKTSHMLTLSSFAASFLGVITQGKSYNVFNYALAALGP